MSNLMLDVDQAGELKAAFRREGPWTNGEIKMLTEQKGLLRKFREVLLGHAKINFLDTLIDCDADPYRLFEKWKVRTHKKGGSWSFNPEEVELFPVINFGNVRIRDLADEFVKLPILNANVLDHLIKRPYLMPDEWEGKRILFAGTIYESERSSSQGLEPIIRFLEVKGTPHYFGGDTFRSFYGTPLEVYSENCVLPIRK